MFTQKPSGEQGQSMVLIALASVALIAFVALAVDGGLVYTQRRAAQNAADGAALTGAFRILIHHRRYGPINEALLLSQIHTVAEAHGVPDTDGAPGNDVNGNVVVQLTNTDGDLMDPCRVGTGTCPADVLQDAWGTIVSVRKPFETLFAGVIGWSSMTVAGSATAVTHAGASGANNDWWAVFASNRLVCADGTFGTPWEVSASGVFVSGNAHANGDYLMDPSDPTVVGQITYAQGAECRTCSSSPSPTQKGLLTLELPSFDEYRALVDAQATGANRFASNLDVTTNMTVGSNGAPFVWIPGNLTVRSGATLTLTGLTYVGGHIDIQGKVRGNNSIVVEGQVNLDGIGSSGSPYRNGTYPLLDMTTFKIFARAQLAEGPCSAPVVTLGGRGHALSGAVIAPNGHIQVTGNAVFINGALIGNTVAVEGLNHTVSYVEDYFPPQPDRTELLR